MPAERVARGAGDGDRIDARVRAKAPILGVDQELDQLRRDVAERGPAEPAPVRVDAPLVQQRAVAIEQDGLAARAARAQRPEARQRRRRRRALGDDRAGEQRGGREQATTATRRHGATSSAPFGRSPMRSGA